jgi:polysaccharide biosynthesis/export protein
MFTEYLRLSGFAFVIILLTADCAAQNQGLHGESKCQQPYVIRTGDQLQILVRYEPNLARMVTVQADGSITMRLVGSVRAAGLTTGEFGDVLAQRLQQFVREPRVGITVIHASLGDPPPL